MKSNHDETRTTAYALGEMSGRDRKRFEGELDGNDSLLGEIEDTQRIAGELKSALSAEPCPTLLDSQRHLVMRQIAGQAAGSAKTAATTLWSFSWPSIGTWLAAAAIAVVGAVAVIGVSSLWRGEAPPVGRTTEGDDNEQGATDGDDDESQATAAVDKSRLPRIVLRVGESTVLKMTAVGERGGEWALDSTAVEWSMGDVTQFIAIDAETGQITGLAATPTPRILTARLGEHTASLLVEVVADDGVSGAKQ